MLSATEAGFPGIACLFAKRCGLIRRALKLAQACGKFG